MPYHPPNISAHYEGGVGIHLAPADTSALGELLSDESFTKYFPEWWSDFASEPEGLQEHVLANPDYAAWGVHFLNEGMAKKLVGIAGYFRVAQAPLSFTYLSPDARRSSGVTASRGYAGTEVVRIVIADMFVRQGLLELGAYVNRSNDRSLAMIERLGMGEDTNHTSAKTRLFKRKRPETAGGSLITMIQALGANAILSADYTS